VPNLLLTNTCNRSCAYCFALAQVKVGTTRPNWEMSQAELETVLGYLDPRFDPVSLLGGEPTLHSRFTSIVHDIVGRGFDVKIFTNGTTPPLREIDPADLEALTVILNLNPRETYRDDAWGEIEANGRFMGPRMRVSLNVDGPRFTWDHIVAAIEEWNLGRLVRLGVTQPIRGMANRYLKEPDIPEASRRIVRMAQEMAERGITIGFDCGFRTCSFTEEERGILAECGTQFLFSCRPVLDIGPELMCWRCFPFSVEEGLRLTDFESLPELSRAFEEKWGAIACRGNVAECPSCEQLLTGVCRGGCLSRTLLREVALAGAGGV